MAELMLAVADSPKCRRAFPNAAMKFITGIGKHIQGTLSGFSANQFFWRDVVITTYGVVF